MFVKRLIVVSIDAAVAPVTVRWVLCNYTLHGVRKLSSHVKAVPAEPAQLAHLPK